MDRQSCISHTIVSHGREVITVLGTDCSFEPSLCCHREDVAENVMQTLGKA